MGCFVIERFSIGTTGTFVVEYTDELCLGFVVCFFLLCNSIWLHKTPRGLVKIKINRPSIPVKSTVNFIYPKPVQANSSFWPAVHCKPYLWHQSVYKKPSCLIGTNLFMFAALIWTVWLLHLCRGNTNFLDIKSGQVKFSHWKGNIVKLTSSCTQRGHFTILPNLYVI